LPTKRSVLSGFEEIDEWLNDVFITLDMVVNSLAIAYISSQISSETRVHLVVG
jgi:hypothetical protein